MMPMTHNDLIEKLDHIRELSPNIRFGQLIANLGMLVEDQTDQTLWDVADTRLLEIMEEHRADLIRRHQVDA